MDDHAALEFHAQSLGERLQAVQRPGVGEPEQVAAAAYIVFELPDLARQKPGLRPGDHQHRGVLRNLRVAAERQAAGLDAALGEFPGPQRQVVIGLALRTALAVAGHEYQPAFAAACQARERVGQAVLAVALDFFAGLAVFHDQFAVELHVGGATRPGSARAPNSNEMSACGAGSAHGRGSPCAVCLAGIGGDRDRLVEGASSATLASDILRPPRLKSTCTR